MLKSSCLMCSTNKWDTKNLRRLRGTCVHQCSGMDCHGKQQQAFAHLQTLSPVCPAGGSRLGTITFEGDCFLYKYRRNRSSCQSTQCCRDCAGAPELGTQQLVLILNFWSAVMSSSSHYITSLVPWKPFPVSCMEPASHCDGNFCLKLLGLILEFGLIVEAEVVLATDALGPHRNGWLWLADSKSMWKLGSTWHSAGMPAPCCNPDLARSVVALCHMPGSNALGAKSQLWDSLAHWRRLAFSWARLRARNLP